MLIIKICTAKIIFFNNCVSHNMYIRKHRVGYLDMLCCGAYMSLLYSSSMRCEAKGFTRSLQVILIISRIKYKDTIKKG